MFSWSLRVDRKGVERRFDCLRFGTLAVPSTAGKDGGMNLVS